MKKTSMRDIARVMGVSVVTVSNALGGKNGMTEELRNRICEKAREMGYEYPSSRDKGNDKPLDIGILVPERFFGLNGSYYGMLYRKLVQELNDKGHFALLELLKAEDEENLELPMLVRSKHVDGLILLGEPNKEYYRSISGNGTPVVFLDFYDEAAGTDSVVGDNTYGCYRLTCHLIKNGHRNIGFVGTPQSTSSIMDRYLGFYRALLGHGLAVDDEWVLEDRDRMGKVHSIVLPEHLPDAFVCNCDGTAGQVIHLLKERGLRVPEDISVTGFDDFNTETTEGVPELSTFRVDTDSMIRIAVSKIIERCNGSNTPFERIVVGGQPIYRDSDR